MRFVNMLETVPARTPKILKISGRTKNKHSLKFSDGTRTSKYLKISDQFGPIVGGPWNPAGRTVGSVTELYQRSESDISSNFDSDP